MQDVIDMTGYLTHTVRHVCRQTGRCDLLYLSVVFGVIVEELVGRHHLSGWQHNRPLLRLKDTDGNLRTLQKTLHHDLRTLQHGLADGGSQLILVFHLRHTETAAVGGRFHETGHTDAFLNLVVSHQFLVALANQQRVGHAHAIATQILIQHELVEGHRLHQYPTGTVGDADEVEIALQHTVLTRCTVNGDIGIVEQFRFPVLHKREVVAVDLGRRTVRQFHMPVLSLDIYDIYIVALLVEERV